jgi:hypothetical protein
MRKPGSRYPRILTIINLTVMLLITVCVQAQKKALDILPYQNWHLNTENIKISNDGNFAITGDTVLVLHDLKSKRNLNLAKFSNPNFSNSSKQGVFQEGHLKINILDLYTRKVYVISNASAYNFPQSGINNWICYTHADNENSVTLFNIVGHTVVTFDNVAESTFDGYGSRFVIKKRGLHADTLLSIALNTLKTDTICSSGKIGQFIINDGGKRIAFTASTGSEPEIKSRLYIYALDHLKMPIIVDNVTTDKEMLIDNGLYFDKSGQQVFFQLKKERKGSAINSVVEIWNYKDQMLKPQLIKAANETYTRCAVYNIATGKVFFINGADEDLFKGPGESSGYILVSKKVNAFEQFFLESQKDVSKLISTKTGESKLLTGLHGDYMLCKNGLNLSPGNNYLVFYSNSLHSYGCYDIIHDKFSELKINQAAALDRNDTDESAQTKLRPYGIAGWSENDKTLYVYDKYDIWKLDPKGLTAPVCITGYEGKKKKITFRMITRDQPIFDERLTICGFNELTKQNGFYRLTPNYPFLPNELVSGNFLFYNPETAIGFKPLKAKHNEVYLVSRMSAEEYPNLYMTKDFKKFSALTNAAPQINYNWLKTELVHWEMLDGEWTSGILYKPENFDPTKKYPVIFHFYQKLSDNLNEFPMPGYTKGNINIPFFVSNGYVVLDVDIQYNSGRPGVSAYNAVESAALFLSGKSWADPKKFGLQGHSFGGFEVNFILTRSKLFAAACAASAASNLITSYGGLHYKEQSGQNKMEVGQYRIEKTLWDRPDLYIENSPVLHTGNISTPLLLMNNQNDGDVDWSHGIEMFTALRRQQKPVWMLQYKNGSHTVTGKDAEDYSHRLTQFFDHYLKGQPIPKWMNQSMSNDFDLDTDDHLKLNNKP